jgi:DNA-binding NarL/FixJ family response regulator
LVREILADYLLVDPNLEVVGEAADGVTAVRQVAALQPDVVLMDMQMPGMNGVTATAEIRSQYPDVIVLGLTSFETDRYVVDLLRAGASGYLVKDTSPDVLKAAIRTVAGGGSVLSPEVTRYVIRGLEESRPATAAPDLEMVARFTEKELQIIQLLSSGMNNREISEKMKVSESTIKSRFTAIADKLGARDRVQVLVKAIEYGLADVHKL